MALRDGYSGFAFFQAIPSQDIATGVALDGPQIDTRGYDTVTFVAETTTQASVDNTTSYVQLILQHGSNESAAGLVSQWSDVHPRDMIHSVVGVDGAYSTSAELGIWQSVGQAATSLPSAVYYVGYKGTQRYLRMRVSASVAAAFGMSMGAICILGKPANWPVNEPV